MQQTFKVIFDNFLPLKSHALSTVSQRGGRGLNFFSSIISQTPTGLGLAVV